MDPNVAQAATLLAQTGLGAFATKIIVDTITIGWPTRPVYVGPVAGVCFGIGLMAVQYVAAGTDMTSAAWANAVLNGIIVGGAASGGSAIGNSAKDKREAAKTSGDASGSAGDGGNEPKV